MSCSMKIVIINGSPRKDGTTAKILHAFENQFSTENNVQIEYINIAERNIRPCTGCMLCYKTGKCCLDDEADRISELIGAADGIIIGTPTYASNVSGQLKTLIDRGHFVIEQLLHGKYAISVATGVNYGNKDAAKVLDKLFGYSGALISGSIVCNVPFNVFPCDDKMMRRIAKLSERFCHDIRGKKQYPLQKLIHTVIFSFGIRPFVRSQGKGYQGVQDKWKSIGIRI